MGIAVGGGSISIASLVISFVIWSLKRNVEHEDTAKKKAETKQELFDRELQKLRDEAKADVQKLRDESKAEVSTLRTTLSDSAHKAEMTAHDARTQLANLAGAMGELKGALGGLREAYEEGRDKQAAFYRNELAKFEQGFRQELTRHLHPDLPERVSKLEALVEALAAKQTKKR